MMLYTTWKRDVSILIHLIYSCCPFRYFMLCAKPIKTELDLMGLIRKAFSTNVLALDWFFVWLFWHQFIWSQVILAPSILALGVIYFNAGIFVPIVWRVFFLLLWCQIFAPFFCHRLFLRMSFWCWSLGVFVHSDRRELFIENNNVGSSN